MEFSNRLTFEEWKDVYKKWSFGNLNWKNQMTNRWMKCCYAEIGSQCIFHKILWKQLSELVERGKRRNTCIISYPFQGKLFPEFKNTNPVFVIVIDNLRYDQWKTLQPTIEEYYHVIEDDLFLQYTAFGYTVFEKFHFQRTSAFRIEKNIQIIGFRKMKKEPKTSLKVNFNWTT